MSDQANDEIDAEEQQRLDEERRIKEEEVLKEREANKARVAFTPANVKFICSKHAGSILATAEPSLTKLRNSSNYNDLMERAKTVFNQELTNQNRLDEKTLSSSLLVELLYNMGYNKNKDALQDIINKLLTKPDDNHNNEPNNNENNNTTVFEMDNTLISSSSSLATDVFLTEYIDEIQYCDIVTRFDAPAFYYGQRLRRNAGRGQLQEMVELLIRGCNPNTADGEGLTSLHYASEFNRVDVIRALYELSGDTLMLNPRDKYGWTPMYCGAHHGNIEVVRLLLELGADPSITNAQMKTPLHCAAAQGRKEICKLLIDAGASLNTQDKHYITPLHDCNFKGHFDLFEYLINDSNSEISEIKVEGSEEGEGGTEVTEVEKKKQPIPRGEIIRDILGYSPEDYSGEYKYQEEVNDLEELSIKAERKSSSRSPSRGSKRSSSTRPESKQRESRRK